MPYEIAKDPLRSTARDQTGFAPKGARIDGVTGSDLELDPYTRIEIVQDGTIEVLPIGNADGVWVPFGTKPAGYIVPYIVRAVKAGSTAHFITLDF